MYLLIYNIYVDSIIFVRRNLFVVVPSYLQSFLGLGLGVILDVKIGFHFLIYFLVLISSYLLIETFIVAYVFRREEIIDSKESVVNTLSRCVGRVLLMTVYYCTILFLFMLVLVFFFNNRFSVLQSLFIYLFVFLVIGTFPLGLRYLVLRESTLPGDAMKAGAKALYKNFFFFLFVMISGALIIRFPSLIMPSSWIFVPVLPVAEYLDNNLRSGFNWLGFLLNPLLLSLSSIALTYAFLSKNQPAQTN